MKTKVCSVISRFVKSHDHYTESWIIIVAAMFTMSAMLNITFLYSVKYIVRKIKRRRERERKK